MRIETVSFDSVMLYFGDEISEEVLDHVQSAYTSLKSLANIIDLTPSYTSILLQYDIFYYDTSDIQKVIITHLSKFKNIALKKGKEICIEVDYSQGLDLQRVADFNQLSIEEVIQVHSAQRYRVYAVGFMVGFAYLAKVPSSIQTPRLETPRAKVPKGAVALAQTQTAIYPQASSGGWNILGHTDFNDFDSFEIGDSVRFIDVSL
ncbi:MAG: carboxyltransferase domain-containing protein [Sulfurovum sp.]|nr:carboxyltransferase domain-containing protein [Sulfurovum sp.]